MIGVVDASATGAARRPPIGAPASAKGRTDASLSLGRLAPLRRNPAHEKPGSGPRLLDPGRKEHP
jgi:hypothetical protein